MFKDHKYDEHLALAILPGKLQLQLKTNAFCSVESITMLLVVLAFVFIGKYAVKNDFISESNHIQSYKIGKIGLDHGKNHGISELYILYISSKTQST